MPNGNNLDPLTLIGRKGATKHAGKWTFLIRILKPKKMFGLEDKRKFIRRDIRRTLTKMIGWMYNFVLNLGGSTESPLHFLAIALKILPVYPWICGESESKRHTPDLLSSFDDAWQ